MATVFDYARGLSRALRESDEHRQMRRLASKVKGEERLEKILAEFRLRQVELQAAHLRGEKPGKEETDRLERLGKSIQADSVLREYLQAETAYGRLLVEVQQILAESFNPDLPGPIRPSGQG